MTRHTPSRWVTAAAFVASGLYPAVARAEWPAPTCPAWYTVTHDAYPLKVWVCSLDPAKQAKARQTLDRLAPYWEPMTRSFPDGMGPPLGDESGTVLPRPGGRWAKDDEIDFYIIDGPMVLGRTNNGEVDESGGYPARAVHMDPCCSSPGPLGRGYVLLDAAKLDGDEFLRIAVHEFFHLLQFRWGVPAYFTGPLDGRWFTEASATWAETYYRRANSARTHKAWFLGDYGAGFQHQPLLSLLDLGPSNNNDYRSYEWPLFIEQQLSAGGGRNGKPIFEIWRKAHSVATYDQIHEIINQTLPFETNFRDFAVRNLNLTTVLHEAGEETYKDFDDNFPNDVPPDMPPAIGITATPFPRIVEFQEIRHLKARYLHFASIAPNVHQLDLDFSDVLGLGNIDVDAMVKIRNGKWERRRLGVGGVSWCIDWPADHISEFYLILSNHNRFRQTGPVEGNFKVHGRDVACSDFKGRAEIIYQRDHVNTTGGATEEEHSTIRLNANLQWVTDRSASPSAGVPSAPPSMTSFARGRWVDNGSTWHLTGSSRLTTSCTDRFDRVTRGGTLTLMQGDGKFRMDAGDDQFNVRVGWTPEYSLPIGKMPTIAGAPKPPPAVAARMAALPADTVLGGDSIAYLTVHPRLVRSNSEASGCLGTDTRADTSDFSIDGCAQHGRPDGDATPAGVIEGRARRDRDGSGWTLDFTCSQTTRDTEGTATTTVRVTGSLHIRRPNP